MDRDRAASNYEGVKVNDENLFKNQSYDKHKKLQKQNEFSDQKQRSYQESNRNLN